MNINLSDAVSSVDFKRMILQGMTDSVNFRLLPPTNINLSDTTQSVIFTDMSLSTMTDNQTVRLVPPISLQFSDTVADVIFNEMSLGTMSDGTEMKVIHPIKLQFTDTAEVIDLPDLKLKQIIDVMGLHVNQYTGVSTMTKGVRIILSNRAHDLRGEIHNIPTDTIHITSEMVNGNSIAFDVYKYLDGEEDPLYDEIEDLRLVYVPELRDFLEITITDYDSVNQRKSVQGVSAGIAELSQTLLYGFEVNTEADIARDDYVVTKFYNIDNAKASLLHRVLYKLPQWNIGEVPRQLQNVQRTFSANAQSVWDFLSQTVAEEVGCIFQIDNVNKVINVRDMKVYCNSCRKRVEPYFERVEIEVDDEGNTETLKKMVCPKCGSSNLEYFGEDTTMLINKEIFSDEIQLTMDAGGLKNTMRLEAGDDLMTATVQALNPNGAAYITRFDESQLEDMPTALVDRINSYSTLYESYEPQYQQDVYNYYDAIDNVLYYQSGMMPEYVPEDITAESEAAKLTVANLSPMSLSKVTSSTSIASVNAALRLYASVYVKTGYVKVEVIEGAEFTYYGTDPSDPTGKTHYGLWTGAFKVTNYSDQNDTATTNTMTITVNDAYEDFLKQKIAKQVVKYDDDEGSIYNVLSIQDLDTFKEALKLYCVNRLVSFRDAIQGCIDILVQEQQANAVAEFYNQIYLPYFNKLTACEEEISRRSTGYNMDGTENPEYVNKNVQYWSNQRDAYIKEIRNIQSILNFENYLGPQLYQVYCAYRREDTYTNSNFSSEGLTNTELFQKAQEYLELANNELIKASTPQYSLSCDLYNLLEATGYELAETYFMVGNWIRVEADGRIFRLRLIEIEIDYSDLTKVKLEFSTVTQTAGIMSDMQSVINSARSMATTFGSVANQAEFAAKTSTDVTNFVETGLLSAMGTLKNNDNEEISINEYGIMAKTMEDDGRSYNPEQLRITHNILAFTSDGWATSVAALGKHDYQTWSDADRAFIQKTDYGLTAQFVTAGQINGSQMIGGNIYSSNYVPAGTAYPRRGTHIDLLNGHFEFAGGNLTFDGSTLSLIGNISASNISGSTITGGSITGSDIYSSNWNAQTGAGCHIALDDGEFSFADGDLTYLEDSTTHTRTLAVKGNISASNISGSTITGTTITGGSITGTTINNGNGTFTVDAAGNLTATSATISGTIEGTILSGSLIEGTTITGGSINIGDGQFTVDSNGNVICNNITIRGGDIGGCTVTPPTSPSGDGKLVVPADHLSSGEILGHEVTWHGVSFVTGVRYVSAGDPFDIKSTFITNPSLENVPTGVAIDWDGSGEVSGAHLTYNGSKYLAGGSVDAMYYKFNRRFLMTLCYDQEE